MRAKSHTHVLGPALMVLTMALYVANDTLVKLLGREMPLGAIISLRGFLILGFMLVVLLLLPGHGVRSLKWLREPSILVRSLWDTAVTFLYLFALLHMPIANILAIMNLSPLVIMPLAAWRLGERIGPRRILAVAAGFAGALLVVRPGPAGFDGWAVLAFLAMAGVAARDISTRGIPSGAPSLVVALANVLLVQVAGLGLWAFTPSAPPDAEQWLMLAGCALFLGSAYVLIVVAVRIAPVSSTSAWRYSIIFWGVLAGWLVFGELPDAPALAGIAIILASSLYASLRQAKRDPAA